MNDTTNKPIEPAKADAETGTPEETKPTPSLSPELLAAGRASDADWKSGTGPGRRWATIGCGLGIVILIVALFAGSSLMRKTVWVSFAGATRQVENNLPGGLEPGQRMRLTRNLDAFATLLKRIDDPYPAMGKFQGLARTVLEDHVITSEEVEQLNTFLEGAMEEEVTGVPYSMPSTNDE